ncbi:potassium channel family protein [Halobacterium litoreum]|uniref:Potassium channel family protein n=1 Tax=Halobacterium litoreum TaxID=2039234 RepID=A0ABD5NI47_9EURY|nr:NAD-binding protein [Halobacterium litoreum]UHH12319.1 NAD-binding protein [Halobacterium litoreum]
MNRQQRRGIAYVVLLVAVALTFTVLYKFGMAAFEGYHVSYVQSFHFVIETLTTTGYGEFAEWETTVMLLFVDLMQVTGVFLLFLTLPMFVVPWVEERLEIEPPTAVDLEDHVVICGFGERGKTLASEFDAQGVDYVIVDADRDDALALHEDGHPVVHGDPESTQTLERADVADARAVVLDENDELNATIALTVDELAPGVQTVCFVEDPSLADYLRYAGADRVLSPRQILGRSLAQKVTAAVTPQLGDAVEVGEDFEIVEMPIQHDSEIEGVSLESSGIRERTGVNVIGAWFAGEFVGSPDPDRALDRNTILLVAGREAQLESLKRITLAEGRSRRTERVIVAGYGEVGTAVREVLDSEDIDTTVVDERDLPGVDVVGDVTEEGTLSQAGIGDASALILALGDDTATVFSTLVAREASEDVEIICRANDTESVPKLYAAGADYVLSLSTVAGRMLAQSILGEDVMALDKQIDIVRTQAPNFEGQTLAEADIRHRTGVTVIAVERDGTVVSELDADFRIQPTDALVVAGADEDIAAFNEAAGAFGESS